MARLRLRGSGGLASPGPFTNELAVWPQASRSASQGLGVHVRRAGALSGDGAAPTLRLGPLRAARSSPPGCRARTLGRRGKPPSGTRHLAAGCCPKALARGGPAPRPAESAGQSPLGGVRCSQRARPAPAPRGFAGARTCAAAEPRSQSVPRVSTRSQVRLQQHERHEDDPWPHCLPAHPATAPQEAQTGRRWRAAHSYPPPSVARARRRSPFHRWDAGAWRGRGGLPGRLESGAVSPGNSYREPP